jgi:hypothetical protein
MAIVQSVDGDADLFRIELSAQPPPTPPQLALKEKIEPLLQKLGDKRSDPKYRQVLKRLKEIAQSGFDGVGGVPADPIAAIAAVQSLEAEIQKLEQPAPASRLGAFMVSASDDSDGVGPREIVFDVTGNVHPVPADQTKLKGDVESSLTVLQLIFPDKNWQPKGKKKGVTQRRFEEYRTKLIGAAQVGLQTPADPATGQQSLQALQDEILAREGPRVKNGYMKLLGMWALGFAVAAAVAYLVLRNNPSFSKLLFSYRNLLVVWTGTMIGTWLSFGIRRVTPTFKDLGNLEADLVEPAVRLVFTGLIAVTLSLVFICGMVKVDIGGLQTSHLLELGSRALLIGILMGVSEQALPSTLTRRAAQFVTEVGGKPT